MLLAAVVAAAEFAATAEDSVAARAETGRTVDLLLRSFKRKAREPLREQVFTATP
jgi:hypothetical protein